MLTLGTLTMLLLAARSTIVHPWILTTPICGRYIHSSTALFSTDDGKASASSSSSPDSTPKRSRKPANLSRFRQHVNPLASRYQQSLVSPSASTITDAFSDPSKPVHLDVGCAKGTFILEMSALDPDTNYLGLEIRPPVVEFALERLTRRSLTNCHFIECNANVDARNVTRAIRAAGGRVKTVTVQFPDPHFKEKHKKRRVTTPQMVADVAEALREGGRGDERVYLASDIKDVLDEMRAEFRDSPEFVDATPSLDEYYPDNVNGVPTERELSVLKQGKPVWRALFTLS